MKSTTIIFLLLFAGAVQAQTGEYYFTSNPFEYEGLYMNRDLQKSRVASHVKTITQTTTTYKKGEPQKETLKSVYTLNEKGETILKEEFDTKGQLMRKQSFVLNDSGWVEQKKISDGKGTVLYQYDKKYDPVTGNITSYEYYKNGKLKSKYAATYSGKYLTEKVVYEKDGVNVFRRFVYSFNSEMKLQTTHLYDGKGKLLHTWNHDCLPEGELMAARKDTTTVCKMREDCSDGRFVNYIKSVNEKGQLTTTTVWYRNDRKADSIMVVTEGKHPTTQMSRYSNNGKQWESTIMDDQNKITYKYFQLMSENGNQLKNENWNYSKKHGLRCTYNAVSEENDNGLLSKSAIFLNGDLWHETTYTYTFF